MAKKKEIIGYLINIDGKNAKLKKQGNVYETVEYYKKKCNAKSVYVMQEIYKIS